MRSGHPPNDDAPSALDIDLTTMEARRLFASGGAAGAPAVTDGGVSPTPAWIDHFRVLRSVGEGGMGRVLLARDTRLGRLVALKVLKSVGGTGLAQALLDEARTTARLSHPHVLTIHDVGSYLGAPYLALEYVDGASLADRLAAGRMVEGEALRIAADVASGLAAAHLAGITHCDLKPGNVLISTDGRVRVADFGIAHVIDSRSGLDGGASGALAGTPAYMSPEQWQGAMLSGATDVWALAVMVYELVTGRHAFAAEDNSAAALRSRVLDPTWMPARSEHMSDALWALLIDMLSRDPARRPHATQVCRRMRTIVARAGIAGGAPIRPFRGLRPFEQEHARLFFGREEEIAELLEKARTTTVLPVVGPSGVGKSSLVLAGLVPRLRERGDWMVFRLRPGSAPFSALAQALNTALANEPRFAASLAGVAERMSADALRDDPRQLNLLLHDIAAATDRSVLLVVDQLEEVLTHAAQDEDASPFIAAIMGAADAVDPDVRVVFTLREDFLGRAAIQSSISGMLSGLTLVRPMARAQLLDAVERPLEVVGYRWQSHDLVAQIVDDALGSASPMPLLQFACDRLWQLRDVQTSTISAESYRALGGVDGIVARHAEATLRGLNATDSAMIRPLLLQLVSPAGTRRVVSEPELRASLGPAVSALLSRLCATRLLVSSVNAGDDGALQTNFEISHESLARTWPRLRRWLDESVDARRAIEEVSTAAQLWHARGQLAAELWDASAVADARRRVAPLVQRLPARASAFLDAAERRARRQQRRRRTLLAALIVGLLGLTTAAGLAAVAYRDKVEQIQRQTGRLLTAAADIGTTTYDLHSFDWTDDTLSHTRAAATAISHVAIYNAAERSRYLAGSRRDDAQTAVTLKKQPDGDVRVTIRTRGGPAVLRIYRVGCAHSDVPVEHLNGFKDTRPAALAARPLLVPTCAATRAGTTPVPAGLYQHGGPGVPPIKARNRDDPFRLVWLPAYRMDITETRNATWDVFDRMRAVTGVRGPAYPGNETVRDASAPQHPVSGVDAFTADAFCAWMGKRLPTSEEWTKAGRGGLLLADGLPNPMPNRNLPWGGLDASARGQAGRANLIDTSDAWRHSAPAGALPACKSPTGVLDMGGNMSEWTSSTPSTSAALRVVRDAEWSFRADDGLGSLSVSNLRSPHYFLFSLGFRCLAPASSQHASDGAGQDD